MTNSATVIIVGCGCPLKSMGWYHATQLLDNRVSDATLKYIVEPFYMSSKAKGTPGYDSFQNWRLDIERSHGVQCFERVQDVPTDKINSGEKRLVIISARTSDNPALFSACLDIQCDAIFLEKPGAPTVVELEQMKNDAKAKGVDVFMGFNKNVSSYVKKSRDVAQSYPEPCEITFLHNNAYQNTEAELAECFERCSEGMLKNMAIHELALLVTYYGVSVDSIESVKADTSFSSCKSLTGPFSGKTFSDFDKLKFKVTTKSGVSVNVAADRCGGDDSVAIVTKADTGEEVARFTMPDEEAIANIPTLQSQYPGSMPYFFTQDPDYLTLKQRVVNQLVHGIKAEGVATIDVACETLKVAELLTPMLQSQLAS